MKNAHLLSTEKEFSGAMYLGLGTPPQLFNQTNHIQEALNLFESLPTIEQMRMFFVTAVILLEKKELCLDSNIHFRINRLKQIKSFLTQLINKHTHKIDKNPDTDIEKGLTLILQGLAKIYQSESYTDAKSIGMPMEEIFNQKELNLLGQFSLDLSKILIPPQELNNIIKEKLEEQEETSPELFNAIKNIVKQYMENE